MLASEEGAMTRKGIVAGEPDHTGLGRRSHQLQRLLRRSRPSVGRHERPEAADGQAELEPPGRPGPILRAGLVGVTLIGVGMAGVGVKALVDNERFLAKAAVADGVVVSVKDVVARRQTGSGTNVQVVEETQLYPVVRFTTARGQVVQFQAAPNSNPPHHRVGGSIRLLYDPANPQQVTFDTWRNRWGEGFILLSAGIGLVAIGAAIFMLLRSGRFHLWVQRIVSRGSPSHR
jgi:hypothetical protein